VNRSNALLGLVAVSLALSGCSLASSALREPVVAHALAAHDMSNCEVGSIPPVDESFTPADQRLTGAIERPLLSFSTPISRSQAKEAGFVTSMPDSLGDVPLQLLLTMEPGVLEAVYSKGQVGDSDTASDIVAAGGAILSESPRTSKATLADRAIDALGKDAALIPVGATSLAYNHGDPVTEGVRPYLVFWSDSSFDYAWTADADLNVLVRGAASMVCNG